MFRGPVAGRAEAMEYLTEWDGATSQGVVWKAEIPLPGKNSPIFSEGKIFLTGADDMAREIYCFDAATGEMLWSQPFDRSGPPGEDLPDVMEDTGYAAPTVATDGERVFASFANGDVVAYDLEGEFVWMQEFGPVENSYGHAASLAMHEDKVIMQLDQTFDADEGLSALIALDAATGEEVWRTTRPVPNSWSSPIVIRTDENTQIITTADPYVISYNPETGEELWRVECLMGDVGPSACYADGLVYAANDMADVLAIRATAGGLGGAAGDIVWTADEGLPDTSSPASNGDIVILVTSYGTVTCYGAKDGAKLWEEDLGATFNSSPMIVGENVYLSDTDGVTHIFGAAREYKSVGTGTLEEPIHATPVFLDGRIYVRSEGNLYCIGAAETEEPETEE